jgi:hypothetical protein
MDTEQVPVPEHAPPQPAKVWPAPAVADSETVVPWLKLAEQVPPQLMPAGLEVTVPSPDFETVRGYWLRVKVAVTVVLAVTVVVQVPVPEHPPPDQPEKTEPAPGDWLSVTAVP